MDSDGRTPDDLARHYEKTKTLKSLRNYRMQLLADFPPVLGLPAHDLNLKKMTVKFKHIISEFEEDYKNIGLEVEKFRTALLPCSPLLAKAIFGDWRGVDPTPEQREKLHQFMREALADQQVFDRLAVLEILLIKRAKEESFFVNERNVMYRLTGFYGYILNGIVDGFRIKTIMSSGKKRIDKKLKEILASDQKNLKNILKALDKLYKAIRETLERLERLGHLFPESLRAPKEFINFIKQYFSGDLIQLVTLPCLPKGANEEDYHRQVKAGGPKIYAQLALYCTDAIQRCKVIIEQNKERIDKWPLLPKIAEIYPSGSQWMHQTVRSVFMDALQYYVGDRIQLISITDVFLLLEMGLSTEALCQQACQFDSSELFKSKIDIISQQFSSSLQNEKELSDWEAVHAQDKKILKEKEQQRRQEADEKAGYEQAILHAKNLELAKIKEIERRKAECKDLLLSSLRNSPNNKVNNHLSEILDGTLKDVLKDDFFAILLQLRLSGSEAIKKEANGSYSIGKNNLTVTLPGFPQSFTLHLLHGKDSAEFVDRASVEQLKDLLAFIGMDSHNFAVFLQELAVPTKCGSPG